VTWSLLAQCYITLNNLSEAETYLLRTTTAQPTDYDSRFRLAQIYDLTNRHELASEALKAIQSDKQLYPKAILPPVEKPAARRAEKSQSMPRMNVLQGWKNLDGLRPLVERGKMDAVGIWLQLASAVLAEFKREKTLFPYERQKKITWFDDEREVTEEVEDEETGVSRAELAKRTFLGLTFEMWFDLFMQVSLRQMINVVRDISSPIWKCGSGEYDVEIDS
jgi:hypothetical protein